MPYGAHETMAAHEILVEKINMITHFNMYAQQARNPQLRDMIVRHQQEEIVSYNELVGLTRGSNRFVPIPPNTEVRGVGHQQIEYGLRNPPQFAPQADGAMTDAEITMGMLCFHKSAARNSSWASLECADPNLRRMLLNASANCNSQAYELFRFMNEQGLYQVPTMNSHTAETWLGSYQPAGGALQSQYGLPAGRSAGNAGASGYGAAGYSPGSIGGPAGTGIGGGLNPGSLR